MKMESHFEPEFEIKSADDGDDNAVVTKALDELRGSLASQIAGIEKKSASRLDKIEARLNRPGIGGAVETKLADLETKAFENYVRRGVEHMPVDEVKTLTVGANTSAGYLAPPQFGNEILKNLILMSPIRQYAKTVQISAQEVIYPVRTGTTNATWTAENTDRTESEPSYTQKTFTPFELATYVDVSQALLEDNAYNLEGELAEEIAADFARKEGAAFVGGTSNGQPTGLLTSTAITNVVNTGVANGFPVSNPADVILEMFHAIPQAFAQNGVWLMNRNTIGLVRQWKDAQGRYLMTAVGEAVSSGMPLTLLGRPIVEAVDMPNVAAGATPIMFGDLSGYRIVDRVGINFLRDPYTMQTKGLIRIHARKRVGADVSNPDRFVKLKVSA